jgi:hypothetical protein
VWTADIVLALIAMAVHLPLEETGHRGARPYGSSACTVPK